MNEERDRYYPDKIFIGEKTWKFGYNYIGGSDIRRSINQVVFVKESKSVPLSELEGVVKKYQKSLDERDYSTEDAFEGQNYDDVYRAGLLDASKCFINEIQAITDKRKCGVQSVHLLEGVLGQINEDLNNRNIHNSELKEHLVCYRDKLQVIIDKCKPCPKNDADFGTADKKGGEG